MFPATTTEGQRSKPPPDYFSRRVRFKLFLLVSVFMLVVVMMEKARDPRTYDWMGFDRNEPLAHPQATAPPPDTRIPVERESRTADIPGMVAGAALPETPWHQPHDERPSNRLQQAEALAWTQLWPLLRRSDRDSLHRWLQIVLAGDAFPRDTDASLNAGVEQLVEQLDGLWSDYLEEQRALLVSDNAQLDDQRRRAWTDVLNQLANSWSQQYRASLQQILSGKSPSAQQQRALRKLQHRLGQFALTRVRDNTLHRGVEQEAWFHLFEILKQTPEPVLFQRSTGAASYLQLFQQPSEYRAKIVTLRGSARMISRFRAPRNIYGITHYFRIALRPQGGPDNPILIYSLEMPSRFPIPREPETHRDVREDIECVGYFFKRLVFRSSDGLRTAPLVLAKVPRWYPPPAGLSEAMPGPLWMSAGALICLLAAIAIAWIAYRQTQHAPTSASRVPGDGPQLSIADDDLLPTPEETLRRLAQSDAKPR